MLIFSIFFVLLYAKLHPNQVPDSAPFDWRFAPTRRLRHSFDEQRAFKPNDTHQPTRGFLYSACGANALREAVISVASLRHGAPTIANASIVTNAEGVEWFRQRPHVRALFDLIISSEIDDMTWGFRLTKISAYLLTPYDQTVFLDVDTFFCRHTAEPKLIESQLRYVWRVLDRYELAATHGGYVSDVGTGRPALADLNSGVVLYKKCDNEKQ